MICSVVLSFMIVHLYEEDMPKNVNSICHKNGGRGRRDDGDQGPWADIGFNTVQVTDNIAMRSSSSSARRPIRTSQKRERSDKGRRSLPRFRDDSAGYHIVCFRGCAGRGRLRAVCGRCLRDSGRDLHRSHTCDVGYCPDLSGGFSAGAFPAGRYRNHLLYAVRDAV